MIVASEAFQFRLQGKSEGEEIKISSTKEMQYDRILEFIISSGNCSLSQSLNTGRIFLLSFFLLPISFFILFWTFQIRSSLSRSLVLHSQSSLETPTMKILFLVFISFAALAVNGSSVDDVENDLDEYFEMAAAEAVPAQYRPKYVL